VEVEPARILLVEDEPLNVELLQLALNNYNFLNQIDIVEDGEQALHYLLGGEGNSPSHPLPDLMLLDLGLPKINGVQVLQQIRNHRRTRDLAVVILTSCPEDNQLNACYALGINSYIVKPLDFERLICVMRRVGLYWMLLKSPLPPPSS
jgi:CheY-like chemotaxis protein